MSASSWLDITSEGDGGVLKKVLEDGDESDKVYPGDHVIVHYSGTLENGEQFDSSVGGKPFEFDLGKSSVIKGWEIGIPTMLVGEKSLFKVKPDYGYGEEDKGSIPPNSTLIFEVKLLKCHGIDVSEDSDGSITKRIINEGAVNTQNPEEDAMVVIKDVKATFDKEIIDMRMSTLPEFKLLDFDGGSEANIPLGIHIALLKMVSGERAIIQFDVSEHPDYMEMFSPNLINRGLVKYELTLVSFTKPKGTWEYQNQKEKLEAATNAKEAGNTYYRRNLYKMALRKYTKALDFYADEDEHQ
ncbi:hypothetical protein ACOME3_010053 [Neoechinorhynchus agilis]